MRYGVADTAVRAEKYDKVFPLCINEDIIEIRTCISLHVFQLNSRLDIC